MDSMSVIDAIMQALKDEGIHYTRIFGMFKVTGIGIHSELTRRFYIHQHKSGIVMSKKQTIDNSARLIDLVNPDNDPQAIIDLVLNIVRSQETIIKMSTRMGP